MVSTKNTAAKMPVARVTEAKFMESWAITNTEIKAKES